ncbi:serine/threonine protein kinase [Pyxidicoccus parkwayensis]|uniref:Serine/threonine protein kinase n=1 Tax=Pyxidicoccus parkwayensis TaxID=2813578 RepID=A0ABX7NXE3_9BACT|nr:serine/threonine-protein kinase [Pyxidicoccus parkwaysis]QSQ20753.1 serine/threonine protein kinase [Pyxidicoccus parkwaysis]
METQRALKDLGPASLPPGTEVGSWRVLELRGRGNYGAVYRVEPLGDPGSGPFALKLATHPVDPRFDREAELLSRVQHPAVPRIHAHGLWAHPAGPFPFLVMDWVEGQPLYDWGREQHPTSRQVLRLLAQVARALEATHAVEAVHRDVKGDNVLVRVSDGQAFLTDFGAGYIRGAPTLTAPPLPPGTPPYRSPEAVRFQWGYRSHPTARYEAQPADDVFALGVTAYRLVTGSYPPPPRVEGMDIQDDDAMPLVPPRLRNPAVCQELDALILRMLAEHPEERLGQGSTLAVALALEEAVRTSGPHADVPLSGSAVPPAIATQATPRLTGHVSSRTTEPRDEPSPVRWVWFAMAVVCLSLMSAATGWFLRPTQDAMTYAEATPLQEARDGGTVSVGDAAVAAPVTILAPVPSFTAPPGLGLPLPERPFPGQRKPPCNRKGEIELRGGCWYELARVKSPCDEDAYDYKGACYLPSFPVQRAPTSAPSTSP